MRRKWWWLLAIPVLLAIVYFAGPGPAKPKYDTEMPVVPGSADSLAAYVSANEAEHKIKPDNEARIVWANDSLRQRTPYAIVYLHGFSASQKEGDPIHRNIAKEFGCNLYLSRLAEHGIDTTDQLINLTPDNYWESAKQALAIGKQLGDKVILMSTSTGGTLSLMLSADYPNDIAAQILMSPNIAINDPNAWILDKHWGLQIARLVEKSNYIVSSDDRPIYEQYWSRPYRIEGAVALEELLETSMNGETFGKVKAPTLLLYYYKDAIHQDSVVKVSAMLDMYNDLSTPLVQKRRQAIPNAGNHVIGSYIKSGDLRTVQTAIEKFLTEIMKMKRVDEMEQPEKKPPPAKKSKKAVPVSENAP